MSLLCVRLTTRKDDIQYVQYVHSITDWLSGPSDGTVKSQKNCNECNHGHSDSPFCKKGVGEAKEKGIEGKEDRKEVPGARTFFVQVML